MKSKKFFIKSNYPLDTKYDDAIFHPEACHIMEILAKYSGFREVSIEICDNTTICAGGYPVSGVASNNGTPGKEIEMYWDPAFQSLSFHNRLFKITKKIWYNRNRSINYEKTGYHFS